DYIEHKAYPTRRSSCIGGAIKGGMTRWPKRACWCKVSTCLRLTLILAAPRRNGQDWPRGLTPLSRPPTKRSTRPITWMGKGSGRSEEQTSELQSRENLL